MTTTTPAGAAERMKPCPKCGGDGMLDDASDFLGDARWTAVCQTEGCIGLDTNFPTQAEAIAAWNATRPAPDLSGLEELIEWRLREEDSPYNIGFNNGLRAASTSLLSALKAAGEEREYWKGLAFVAGGERDDAESKATSLQQENDRLREASKALVSDISRAYLMISGGLSQVSGNGKDGRLWQQMREGADILFKRSVYGDPEARAALSPQGASMEDWNE